MKKVFAKVIKKVVTAAAAFTLAVTGLAYTTTTTTIKASAAETPENYTELIDEMAILVNEAREEAGLAPLTVVPVLNDAAAVRCEESASLFSHTRPNDLYFNSVLDDFAIGYGCAGENLAAGCADAQSTFNQWKNSPGHWANIMNPNYTHIGIGVCFDSNSIYRWHWAQLFIGTNQEFYGQYIPQCNTARQSDVHYGDVDGNGLINTFDLVLVLKNLTTATPLSSTQIASADCMQDGQISLADAIVLKKYILGQYRMLPLSL